MRRQNHSCDQCRKAKRLCDAPPLRETKRSRKASEGGSTADVAALSPCSYCRKTRKACTYQWAKSQIGTGNGSSQSSRSRRSVEPEMAEQRWHPNAQLQSTPEYGRTGFPTAPAVSLDTDTLVDFFQLPPAGDETWYRKPPAPELHGPTLQDSTLPDTPFQAVSLMDNLNSSASVSELPGLCFDSFDVGATAPGMISSPGLTLHSGLDDSCDVGYGLTNPQPTNDVSVFSAYQSPTESDIRSQTARCRSFSSHSNNTSLSPFAANQTISAVTNNNLICENLMRIYQDVLEHALSCWVTEETCPYKMQPFPRRGPQGRTYWVNPRFEESPGVCTTSQQDRAHQPSDRIYRRVIKLDRVAQSAKLIQLTKTEDRAASRALHLAIMAFAAQWAQGSQRQRESYQPFFARTCSTEAVELAEEFDRTLQRSFWAQARDALRACSEMESFRVVCADLIFGLTQRPLEDEDLATEATRIGQGQGSIVSRVSSIISRDTPPIALERAARKMHVLKYNYDAREAGLGQRGKTLSCPAEGEVAMSLDDRTTIGLLYWMAVMFDTVSSSMNERPVVVSDEDCQHDAADEIPVVQDPKATKQCLDNRRWRVDPFIRDSLGASAPALRWPCSYEAASRAVRGSAPVKVLLFRHVSYLQNMVRSRCRGEPIEQVIQNAVAVYRHWNAAYAPLFQDLVEMYETVPPSIQSWFVCIAGHYHLAALMLADLVEFVDDEGLGIDCATQIRRAASVVVRLRSSSAGILSDLARVSASTSSSASQLSDLHFAVSDRTILTEPWTIILIQAFTKAAIFHLGELEEQGRHQDAPQGHDAVPCQTTIARCEECIKALWCLGKKSDIARDVAAVLSKGLGPFILGAPFMDT